MAGGFEGMLAEGAQRMGDLLMDILDGAGKMLGGALSAAKDKVVNKAADVASNVGDTVKSASMTPSAPAMSQSASIEGPAIGKTLEVSAPSMDSGMGDKMASSLSPDALGQVNEISASMNLNPTDMGQGVGQVGDLSQNVAVNQDMQRQQQSMGIG